MAGPQLRRLGIAWEHVDMERHGLANWHRDEVTVLVDHELGFEPVEGARFLRTRRDLQRMRLPRGELPLCRAAPAALLFAAHDRSTRTPQGLLAAAVQPRVTTSAELLDELELLRPLRRSRLFRAALQDIDGGAQPLAEMDVRRMCRRAPAVPHLGDGPAGREVHGSRAA